MVGDLALLIFLRCSLSSPDKYQIECSHRCTIATKSWLMVPWAPLGEVLPAV